MSWLKEPFDFYLIWVTIFFSILLLLLRTSPWNHGCSKQFICPDTAQHAINPCSTCYLRQCCYWASTDGHNACTQCPCWKHWRSTTQLVAHWRGTDKLIVFFVWESTNEECNTTIQSTYTLNSIVVYYKTFKLLWRKTRNTDLLNRCSYTVTSPLLETSREIEKG